jgi:hypothetical protein
MGQVVQVNGDYTIKTNEGGTILLNTGNNIGFVRVTGSLLVDGDTLTVSAENLNVKDNIITLNFGETGAGVSLDYSGIQIDRGTLSKASLLFDEGGQTWLLAEGGPAPLVPFNYTNSNLRLRKILTDSGTDTGDLTLIGFGVGVVKVSGTTNYEQQVTDDDDIPNKKYVDDAIIANPSFQIVRSDTRVTAFDIENPLDQSFFPIGPYVTNPVQDQIVVIVNNKRVALFTEQEFKMRGISIFPEDNKGNDIFGSPISEAVTIQATDTNSNIKLETTGTGKVQITYAMQFDNSGIAPAAVTDTTVVYAGPVASGTSGLYTVNDNYRDELVTKSRALLFSMIF